MTTRFAVFGMLAFGLGCSTVNAGEGTRHVLLLNASDVSKASNAPVYAASDTFLSRGIVGGYMDTTENMGVAMADMALGKLEGRDPSTLAVQTTKGSAFWVDARQLKGWKLSNANLPVGTNLLFKTPTFWEEHRFLVISVLLAFGLQSGFVAYVLIQNGRRRRAEQSLKESELRMAFVFESTNTALWQIKTDERSLWATENCRTLFGLAADNPISVDILLDAVHPEDRDVFVKTMRTTARQSRPVENEFRIVRPDGEVHWILAKGHPRDDDDGRTAKISGIFTDVTALKTAEGDARQQRREIAHLTRQSVLGELSGAIAHELNQPLTAILANAEAAQDLLDGKDADLKQVQDILKDIIDEDNRASEVIRRLHKLMEKGEVKFEPLDLNQLVESTLSLLHGELLGRRINVDLALSAGMPASFGDPVQLQQVVLNLIMNATEAMSAKAPSQRNLSVTTRFCERHIEVAFVDHGHGLDPATQSRLFEPFFTTKPHGLGLGLSICSTIVKSHGGKLSMKNNPEGGATAVIALPIHTTAVPASWTTQVSSSSSSTTTRRYSGR